MVLNDVDYFLIFDPNYFVNMSVQAGMGGFKVKRKVETSH